MFRETWGFSPNEVLIRGRGQHVQVTSRDGEVKEHMVRDAAQIAEICADHERDREGLGIYVRLRTYWGDNSNGCAVAYVHVLHPVGVKINPDEFRFPGVTDEGQALTVDLHGLECDVRSDHFAANADMFYRGYRGY
jgi:hypothetical protein